MYLIDTNIFLEILLGQDRMEECKVFLSKNTGSLYMSDFSLHSIGVILFKKNKEDLFKKFHEDIKEKIDILTLSKESYGEISRVKADHGTDFDDSYQYLIAKQHALSIVTFDRDFEKFIDIGITGPGLEYSKKSGSKNM